MKSCPLYNGQNLNFTGNNNPYALIQKGGKKKRGKKTMRKKNKGKKTRKNKN